MGFFEDLGRKVGQFTHEAREVAAKEATYACENCGVKSHTEHETCPECGSDQIAHIHEGGEPAEEISSEETADADGGTSRE